MRFTFLSHVGIFTLTLTGAACIPTAGENKKASAAKPIPKMERAVAKVEEDKGKVSPNGAQSYPEDNKTPLPDKQRPSEPQVAGTESMKPVIEMPSSKLDATYIKKFLNGIAGAKNAGRGTGSPQNRALAKEIADEFQALGLQATADNGGYLQAFSAQGLATQNIIGVLPGETDEYILIGGHMDHLGVQNGNIYPGADDNASGTTAVIALAHAFSKNPVKLKRGIIFALFSAEELGLFGSIHFVRNPIVPIKKIRFMINLDMIGRYSSNLDIVGLEQTVEGNSLARDLLRKTAIRPSYLSGADDDGRSDHAPFAMLGIPTASFFTGIHPDYHQPTDTVEKLNTDALKTITAVAGDLAFGLAQSDSLTSSNYASMLTETQGKSKGIHGRAGCTPGLAALEELRASLSILANGQGNR